MSATSGCSCRRPGQRTDHLKFVSIGATRRSSDILRRKLAEVAEFCDSFLLLGLGATVELAVIKVIIPVLVGTCIAAMAVMNVMVANAARSTSSQARASALIRFSNDEMPTTAEQPTVSTRRI
jgi:hypothetical protein